MQDTENKHLAIDDVAVRNLAAKILSSDSFQRSPRLSELFRFLLEGTLRGDHHVLHEQLIGVQVFGRNPDYDTSADNIVRTSAFQLRKKLDAYFTQSGADEPVIITIPKGHYVLRVSRRTIAPDGASPRESSENSDHRDGPNTTKGSRRSGWLVSGWIAILLGTLLAGSIILNLRARLGPGDIPDGELPKTPLHGFWESIFVSASGDAYIVPPDAGFSLLQDFSGLVLGLKEFLHGVGPEQTPPMDTLSRDLLERLADRPYTSVSVTSLVFHLGTIADRVGGRAVVRSTRGVSVRDLKTRNLVLLGSSRSNPWVDLVVEQMNFRLEYEGSPPRGIIRNVEPRASEPASYQATASARDSGAALGLIALLPNLDRTGSIVVIAGTTMEGTEASAEILLREEHFAGLMRFLNAENLTNYPYFEAVIRARSIGGAGSSPEILAVRRHDVVR